MSKVSSIHTDQEATELFAETFYDADQRGLLDDAHPDFETADNSVDLKAALFKSAALEEDHGHDSSAEVFNDLLDIVTHFPDADYSV